MREADVAYLRARNIKAGVAAVVLVACTVWIGFVMFSGREVTEIPPTLPCDRFMALVGDTFDQARYEYVEMVASEDRKSFSIGGQVPTEADLAELKTRFEGISTKLVELGAPIELNWNVAIKNRK